MKPALAEEVAATVNRMDPESAWDRDTLDVIDQLLKDQDDLVTALLDVICQATYTEDGLDSMAMSAYADAMRLLADHQMLSITSEYGRRVLAVLTEKGRGQL